jgi:hypothetical protein
MGNKPTCQMHCGEYIHAGLHNCETYALCGRPAKYRCKKIKMVIEYVCGIHARPMLNQEKKLGIKESNLVKL